MDNWTAAFLALVVVGFAAWDGLANGWAASLFLAVKFVQLVDWMAFWR